MKRLDDMIDGKFVARKVNAALSYISKLVQDTGVALKIEFADTPQKGVAVLISAQANEETAKKAFNARSRLALGERIFVFVNDMHNPDLAYKEMRLWGLGEREVEFVHTGDDVRCGLEELYDSLEDGDTVIVGSIADLLSTDTLYCIDAVLTRLEELNILLISHSEFGCSYAELHGRIQTALVLDEALNDGDLSDCD